MGCWSWGQKEGFSPLGNMSVLIHIPDLVFKFRVNLGDHSLVLGTLRNLQHSWQLPVSVCASLSCPALLSSTKAGWQFLQRTKILHFPGRICFVFFFFWGFSWSRGVVRWLALSVCLWMNSHVNIDILHLLLQITYATIRAAFDDSSSRSGSIMWQMDTKRRRETERCCSAG